MQNQNHNLSEKLSYIFTPKSVQVVLEGKPYIVREGVHYNAVLKGIREGNLTLIKDAVFAAFSVSKYLEQYGPVRVERGTVFFNDVAVNDELAERILAARGNHELMTPLCGFMAKVQENPDPRARTDLFGFLSEAKFPLTSDGYIVGLKIVDRNFKDIYTRKMDNRPGSVIKMPREDCDADPSRTCSSGIHFCTPEYLNHYGRESGARVVVYKIHPKDIVAFPRDYNWAKVRCCEALVLEEVPREEAAAFFYAAGFLYEPKKELARALQRGFRFIQSEEGWTFSHDKPGISFETFPTQEEAVNATFAIMLPEPEPEDPEDPEDFTEGYEDEAYPGLFAIMLPEPEPEDPEDPEDFTEGYEDEAYPGLFDNQREPTSQPWLPEGEGWTHHTPGDPQPVEDDVRVQVLLAGEQKIETLSNPPVPMPASWFSWSNGGEGNFSLFNIVAWRLAPEDQCEPTSQPWLPDGRAWIEHTPGDPQPVANEVRVIYLTRRERDAESYFDTPSIKAMLCFWGESDVCPDNDIVAYLIA